MKRLVVATFNPGKLAELGELLDLPGVSLACLAEFAGAAPPEETGSSLLENARLKARAALALTGLPSLADDTGLEVDALGGRPGVHAASFAGAGAPAAAHVERLLRELAGVPPEGRGARFRTVCLACFPGGDELHAEGVLEGRIAAAPRGPGGFGYDPVFEVTGLGRTLAELPLEEKNALSHRARAIRDLNPRLARRMLAADRR